jgi:hypothetical protein
VPTTSNAQPDIARSLPAYVPDTPGKKEKGPRTPHSKKEEMAPRFYPVVKDSSRPHDPQVFAQMRPFIDIRGILCYPFLLIHVCMPHFLACLAKGKVSFWHPSSVNFSHFNLLL